MHAPDIGQSQPQIGNLIKGKNNVVIVFLQL